MHYKEIILFLSLSIFLLAKRNANAQSQAITFDYKGYEQTWQVPSGVTQLTITAIGAGGGGNDTSGVGGGNGATIVGEISVSPHDVLDIFVGGSGEEGNEGGAGGGGGTFIYDATSDTLLEVAGGGGGNSNDENGYDASATTIPNPAHFGGSGENGGTAFFSAGGGGGAGFRGNGGTYSPYTGFAGTGGNDFANGFGGGFGGGALGGSGGYAGGGGGGSYFGGGGGSGYAGGGGSGTNGGGGGSSFVSGTMLSWVNPDTSTENGLVTITWEAPTGIDNMVSATEQITVYPNPSDGQFNLRIGNKEQAMSEIHVEIYNVLGEKVYFQYSIANTQFLIDLSAHPNGIYFCRVIDKNSNVLEEGKMVIQK